MSHTHGISQRPSRPPPPRRGEGRVKQIDGRRGWTAMWHQGGRRYSKHFALEADARAYLAVQIARSGNIDTSTATVAQYVEVFLGAVEAQERRGAMRASTVSTYRNSLSYVRRDRLAAMPLRDVTGPDVGAFYVRLRHGGMKNGGGVSEGTVKAVHRSLSAMFGHAAERPRLTGVTVSPTTSVLGDALVRSTGPPRRRRSAPAT